MSLSLFYSNILLREFKKGFENLYLCTDLEGYDEKYGWNYIKKAYFTNGESTV